MASALEQLKAGNKRFTEDKAERCTPNPSVRQQLENGQKPFAIIVGCSDSRTPPELIFDQGLGDLFIIRAAGNVVGPHSLGSILYAVAHLGSRLVVVMGHTKCGAVAASVDAAKAAPADAPKGDKGAAESPIMSIVNDILPSVHACMKNSGEENLAHEVCKENARNSAKLVKEMLATHCADKASEVQIVAGLYHLEGGSVEFLDA